MYVARMSARADYTSALADVRTAITNKDWANLPAKIAIAQTYLDNLDLEGTFQGITTRLRADLKALQELGEKAQLAERRGRASTMRILGAQTSFPDLVRG